LADGDAFPRHLHHALQGSLEEGGNGVAEAVKGEDLPFWAWGEGEGKAYEVLGGHLWSKLLGSQP